MRWEQVIGFSCLTLAGVGLVLTLGGVNLYPFGKQNPDGVHVSPGMVTIGGLIDDNKADQFVRLSRSLPSSTVVSLTSSGGYDLPAMQIADMVRSRSFSTLVPGNAVCSSACADIWVAGSPRMMTKTSWIGFHAPGYVFVRAGEGRTVDFYRRLGLSEEFISYALKAGPADMSWLTDATANKYGLSVKIVRE